MQAALQVSADLFSQAKTPCLKGLSLITPKAVTAIICGRSLTGIARPSQPSARHGQSQRRTARLGRCSNTGPAFSYLPCSLSGP